MELGIEGLGISRQICKKNENCPPWQIKAKEIKHDKEKKQLIYKGALL